jgi:hypothetical protein
MGRVSAATDVAIGGAQTVSMALGATLVGFVDYRVMFAVIAAMLLGCASVLASASRANIADTARRDVEAAAVPSESAAR